MSEERVVRANISVGESKVTLKGTQTNPGLVGTQTFHVVKGDTLKWVVQGAPPASLVRIRFVGFPAPDHVPLFEDGQNVLEATSGVIISGSVDGKAFAGPYDYLVELVEGDTVTKLTCFWTDDAKTLLTGMGGGVQSGGPSAS
jgi:hypothetical protein